MFASPQLSPAELDSFYDDAFEGDAGSPVFDAQQQYREQKLRSEGKLAARWGIGVVENVMSLQGASVLDLRSRSGALAALLNERGARVVTLDPFEANAVYTREARGLTDVRTMRFSTLHALDGIPDQSFDAVTVLTQHLMSHLLSPRELFTRILAVLRPGGYLILEEKDVLRPGKLRSASVFDTGKAHQFHFTRRTLELYARAVGFEVQSCAIDPDRVSVSQHILLIARRPRDGVHPVDPGTLLEDWEGPDAIVQQLERIRQTWRFHRIRFEIKRAFRKLRRRLAGS
jgi:SAM-dependent methyltransferase